MSHLPKLWPSFFREYWSWFVDVFFPSWKFYSKSMWHFKDWKNMLLQAIVELPSLKPTVRTWKWMDGKPDRLPLFRGSGARVLLPRKSDLTALWLDLKSSRLHLRRWVIPANDSRKILSWPQLVMGDDFLIYTLQPEEKTIYLKEGAHEFHTVSYIDLIVALRCERADTMLHVPVEDEKTPWFWYIFNTDTMYVHIYFHI